MNQLPEFAAHELKKFLESGKPGSLTFNSDGVAVRQVELKLISREGDHGHKEKGR